MKSSLGQHPAGSLADSGTKVTLDTLLYLHRSAAEEYEIAIDGQRDRPLSLQSVPISQWTNIRRAGGQLGHVFVWMDGEEPAAMAAIFSFPWGGDELQRRVVHELHALSPSKLNVERNAPGVVWKPEAGLKRLPLPSVTDPLSTRARFKIQVRHIARRFGGHCIARNGQRWALRVLPTPLMVYPIERDGRSGFGAILGMMGDVGSDLESGAIVEATAGPNGKDLRWEFAPVRMTDMETYLTFDSQPIWESMRSQTDTIFHDTPKVYFRFQGTTVPFEEGR
jgi:hypothetical protein